ncbi:hypothetical protein ARALYDRAFT_899167 [Arabidopsis lyrata subsp. lyrata]|uniref:F-box associated beta-propeller type 3 domain-containing protein n=1 Tax=Arabidopsis lyrata subsp. lyrata TaxID=81972 RepID=D7L6U8_ARALL|nr:hypothetical protein ARALYDRAFT_899167 [Arabidopsis lyrata subsp. lyrata]
MTPSLIHLEGKLISVISRGNITMWSLEDIENQEWSYKHLGLPFPYNDPISQTRFSPNFVNDAGEFIYVPTSNNFRFHIIYFDPNGNSFRRVVVDGFVDDHIGAKMDLETNLSISNLYLIQSHRDSHVNLRKTCKIILPFLFSCQYYTQESYH